MLPDFEMVVHQIPIRSDIIIFPIFDLHLGSRECREQDFIRFINEIAEIPNAYIFLGGDLIDNGLKNSVTNVYRATMMPSAQKKEVAKILEPVRDKLLVAVPGNHERRNKDVDDDPMYDILTKLDKEDIYRENMAFVKIVLGSQTYKSGSRSKGDMRPCYTFCITHGAGGGMLPGATINRNERMAYAIDGIDCFVVGHSHKPMFSQPGKIVVDKRNNRVSVVPFKVISATSWLDYGDYAAQKMLLPTSPCVQKIILSANEKKMTVVM